MPENKKTPLLITLPHSGEKIPAETPWLTKLPETLLMFDVDRYVDQLYAPVIGSLQLENVVSDWHRYAVDLNRLPEDVDVDSVEGSTNPSGKFPRGFHWSITTLGERLMPGPLKRDAHDQIVKNYYSPFHAKIQQKLQTFRAAGHKSTFHMDLHSMPSKGTQEHRDPGEARADIVLSDCDGKSTDSRFLELVHQAYRDAGFHVRINWPYKGGRITEVYGKPEVGQNCLQVELNRRLYMDEKSKRLIPEKAEPLCQQLAQAISHVHRGIQRGLLETD